MMDTFTLIRDIFTTKMTLGIYHFNDKPLILGGRNVFIGEDVSRPEGVKIPHETSITAGEYYLIISYSGRFKRDLPLIYNRESDLSCVSGNKIWTGIRQHNGNTENDTDGCQLLGFTRNDRGVYNSVDCLNAYMPFLREVLNNNAGKVKLTIINSQP